MPNKLDTLRPVHLRMAEREALRGGLIRPVFFEPGQTVPDSIKHLMPLNPDSIPDEGFKTEASSLSLLLNEKLKEVTRTPGSNVTTPGLAHSLFSASYAAGWRKEAVVANAGFIYQTMLQAGYAPEQIAAFSFLKHYMSHIGYVFEGEEI